MDNHLHAAGKDTVAQPETEHECPLCFEMFGASAIHQHAAACQGLSAVEQPPPGSLLQAMRSSDIKPTTRYKLFLLLHENSLDFIRFLSVLEKALKSRYFATTL